MPSAALVALQLASLVAVVLPWNAFGWNPSGFVLLALAAAVGAWTLLHNRPGNFSVMPEPRRGARLVTSGPYAYVRHPMYLAVLLFGAGCVAGWQRWPHAAAFALLALTLHAKALREEKLLAQRFSEYDAYKHRTRRLIPFVL